jgi:hypothetical protein
MPYDNTGSLTSTDPSGCGTELLISNGLFVTPTTTLPESSPYIDYSMFAGNAGLNYSTITPIAGAHRFATFCWKMPTMATAANPNLSFYINSVYKHTRVANINRSGGVAIKAFYAFQNVSNPTFATSAPTSFAPNWNTVWINANAPGTPTAGASGWKYDVTPVSNRYGIVAQSSLIPSPNVTTLTANGIASFYRVFVPITEITATDNVYLYLRIGLPLNTDMRFGSVYATLTPST